MNRRIMPLILMLTAGAITCVITYIREYSITGKLLTLLAVLALFYGLGSLLSAIIGRFERQNEKARREEGAVIEKNGALESETEVNAGKPSEGVHQKN